MSRYEGVMQNGTSTSVRSDGNMTIFFTKQTNPMVLHFSGLASFINNKQEFQPILVERATSRDWIMQSSRSRDDVGAAEARRMSEPSELRPPGLYKHGQFVFLCGELKEAQYGLEARRVAMLPPGCRPKREVRWLAALLKESDNVRGDVIEHSVAVTLRPDGTISVQGGKVNMIDQKGNMRFLPNKKKGRLSFDGIRYSLVDGTPVKTLVVDDVQDRHKKVKGKVGYLMSEGSSSTSTAACCKNGDIVILEGHLSWSITARPPNPKKPLGCLQPGCWPRRRETFLTRGSDLEERKRVDVDQYGRIFCPEGALNSRVELTGILFVAADRSDQRPNDADLDDLKLHYHRNEVNVASASFDGHELLEDFVRRSTLYEWKFIEYDFARHAARKMMMPHGQAKLRGSARQPMSLSLKDDHIWRFIDRSVKDHFGITSFHTLFHLSDSMFLHVINTIQIREGERRLLMERRTKMREIWEAKRRPGMNYAKLQRLAEEIVSQMFEHWDFRAQLQGALVNDYRAPPTIEHLLPTKRNPYDHYIRKKIKPEDTQHFEEVRQFFHLYETTGSNMTHCCLMGSQDIFTTTGKWHYPDAPEVQKQLFEHMAWLFLRGIYTYMVERQTPRFPFIEDLDIQCKTDWQELEPGQKPVPPDALLMDKPHRNANNEVCGDPGLFMRKRAEAVRMVYPQIDTLEAIVFSASGYNKGKDMLKSSFHLVWPQIIVDSDRAPVIRHATLGVFFNETKKQGSFLQHLQNRLLELHESNNWELVFDNTTIHARNGLRMPFSDKGSTVIESEADRRKVKEGLLSKNKAFKKRVREDRPSVAVGMVRFEFEKDRENNDVMSSASWVADFHSHSISEWIHMGTCRRDPMNPPELTQWQLGPEVLGMLPTKPGEEFFYEGECDGEGGHWVTHKPFPGIRRYRGETKDFVREFSEKLKDEQEQLNEEDQLDMLRRVVGTWISVTEHQAVWRASAASQCEAKVPDYLWGYSGSRPSRRIYRPSEVIYLKSKDRIVVDGPAEVLDVLLRVLRPFTKADDNVMMPIYDLTKISVG
eukprot:NODE_116_length_3618_cov_4.641936.p1 GENE.NODE_116_length_3618_cov_4.641936~~NODE_116_length_3618_cov_4.641936.p1  ORF type:complete len:1108 (-),score=300.21 NODE_116_length_3618_cov_4.641936:295-3426(-)